MLLLTVVAAQRQVSKVILDPSALFAEGALQRIAEPELRPYLVVSAALWRRLGSADAVDRLGSYGIDATPAEVDRVRNAIEGIELFSGAGDDLPDAVRRIRDRLLRDDEPFADVLADEWVFITTQSIGAFAGTAAKRAIAAFRRAGGAVHEISDKKMERGLAKIRKRMPPKMLGTMKVVGRLRPKGQTAQFLCFGGGIALLLLPHVALGAGIAASVKQGVAIIAGDP
jgi:hypothetical protein